MNEFGICAHCQTFVANWDDVVCTGEEGHVYVTPDGEKLHRSSFPSTKNPGYSGVREAEEMRRRFLGQD